MKRHIVILFMILASVCSNAIEASGMYQYSVAPTGYVSTETNKVPTAYL